MTASTFLLKLSPPGAGFIRSRYLSLLLLGFILGTICWTAPYCLRGNFSGITEPLSDSEFHIIVTLYSLATPVVCLGIRDFAYLLLRLPTCRCE